MRGGGKARVSYMPFHISLLLGKPGPSESVVLAGIFTLVSVSVPCALYIYLRLSTVTLKGEEERSHLFRSPAKILRAVHIPRQ